MLSYEDAILALVDEWDESVMSLHPFEQVDDSVASMLGIEGNALDNREEIERRKSLLLAKEEAIAMVYGVEREKVRDNVWHMVAAGCRITAAALAREMGVSRQYIHKLIKGQFIAATKVGKCWYVQRPLNSGKKTESIAAGKGTSGNPHDTID